MHADSSNQGTMFSARVVNTVSVVASLWVCVSLEPEAFGEANRAGGLGTPPTATAGRSLGTELQANAAPNAVRGRLLGQFEGLLNDRAKLQKLVQTQSAKQAPEGDIFPYLLAAHAYTNLALEDAELKPQAAKRIAQLIDLATPAVIRKVRPPGGKLENMGEFNGHGTYLGQLNLALACYRLAGGDNRYEQLHKALSSVLHEELVRLSGKPLRSYPDLLWPFDTVPALLSLHLRDQQTGKAGARGVIRDHLKWIQQNGTDSATGLPYSRLNLATLRPIRGPRGCELGWRICLLANLDAPYARRMYDSFVKAFWLDRKVISGFAEWPGGRGKADLDSGPIVQGIGMSATGFGLGAARATGDSRRFQQLLDQLPTVKAMLSAMAVKDARTGQLTVARLMTYHPEYVTGSLLGDAGLFYCITWRRWSKTGSAGRHTHGSVPR